MRSHPDSRPTRAGYPQNRGSRVQIKGPGVQIRGRNTPNQGPEVQIQDLRSDRRGVEILEIVEIPY